jgi:cellulose biosynthesis protein BcsQ
MKIIALVSNKGGAGKTTLTVNFATGLERHGRVAILDADPQRSSLQWRSMSARNDAPSVFDAVAGLTFKARQQANQRLPDHRLSSVGRSPTDTGSATLDRPGADTGAAIAIRRVGNRVY